jgi:hypothetical protein
MCRNIIILCILSISLAGCVSVKEYQKMYLNDIDMELSDAAIESFESGFQTYREGPSGANGGKAGGGCGCN